MLGTTLRNFRILKKLGEGGMGSVYLARDLGLEREVALKVIAPELARTPKLMTRFRVEAIAQAKLNHANITAIHSFNHEKETYYIVMEYVPGKTLRDIISEKGPMPLEQCLDIFSQVLAGIAYAHSQGVVHRDIKPSNIFISPEHRVKIGDFGIAKVKGIEGLTKMGSTLGSPLYSSPEQLTGKKTDARTDIYSLGITLYVMLTGKLPFKPTGKSNYKIIREAISHVPGRPSALVPGIPPALDGVVMKCLAKSPEERFPDLSHLTAAFKAIRASKVSPSRPADKKAPPKAAPAPSQRVVQMIPVAAVPVDTKPPKPPPPPHRKQALIFALVLSIILVFTVILMVVITGPDSHPPPPPSSGENFSPAPSAPKTHQPLDQFPTIVKKDNKTPPPQLPGSGPSTAPKTSPTPSASGPVTYHSAGAAAISKKMAGLIASGQYDGAVGVGRKAVDKGTRSAGIYLNLAKAYFYQGEKTMARQYYSKTVRLGSMRFPCEYLYVKHKSAPGTLRITSGKLSFTASNKSQQRVNFSLQLARVKSTSENLKSNLSGIFKKKRNRKNPMLTIKSIYKQKYNVRLKEKDDNLRSFIIDIINTLKTGH